MNLIDFKIPTISDVKLSKRNIPILEKISFRNTCVIAEGILNESLGSFNQQKEISNKVGREVAYALEHNYFNDISVDVSEFDNPTIQKVVVQIVIIANQTSGAILNVSTDHEVFVRLDISKATIFYMQENELSSHVAYVIGHELMHGYIYLSRYEKQQPLDTTPDYYQQALNIFQKYGADNLFGSFGYALYNTYYHERQAFISQTHLYIQERLMQRPNPSNAEIISMIKDSSAYQAFANNIDKLSYLQNNVEFKEPLLHILNKYGINFSMKDLDNKIEWMIKVSKETIHKIMKNAILALS